MIKRILVPTDGSGHARKAIELAAETALQYNATLYLLHVVSESKIPEEVLDYIKVERIDEPLEGVYLQKIGKGIVSAAEREAKEKGVKEVNTDVVQGDPAEMIIKYAGEKGVDMIMLGSRGLGGIQGLFLGSVSSKVCHVAGCACVTVK